MTEAARQLEEKQRAEDFVRLHKGKLVRAHWIIDGSIVIGYVSGIVDYTKKSVRHWTITLYKHKPIPKHHTVVWSSIQLLDSNGYPITSVPVTEIMKDQWESAGGTSIKQDDKVVEVMKEITTHFCHPECCDGYCHRTYIG